MLSDDERRRLEELEAGLREEDPQFSHAFTTPVPSLGSRRRRVAVWLGVVAGIAVVTGLILGNVPTVVVAICAVGVAAALWLPPR
ncbi:DUF3040 domain-containing protein [Dactylosporangium matsuzakiense]|uniref:DUF3040 domain-containing protein n=1 Tax=Dactylosporangium matsuzakiense TaxID=53360 RepID=A0A9W6NKK1_9ACTN|nr:DUF3040 domain-containing protein [Dactylosporangium matsuzakiense]UWZ42239.1 DUF3040 domain-containing protein [Dactylosporangium matsuzakiense]GLK99891.1 hypothetical protein GCM10017581_016320 [Dactylosporangium matsuzakiense]